jgi:chromosome segregation ATPase
MSDTETAAEAANPDQTHVLAGQLADGRFFGLMHKGDRHPQTVIGRSLAELHRRLTNAAIAEFRMNQDDSTALATESIDRLHGAMTAPPGPTVEQLEELQQEVMLVTAERDKALAEVDTAKAETVALSAELDSTKKTVSDLENKLGAAADSAAAQSGATQFRNAASGQYESGETHDAGKGEADG